MMQRVMLSLIAILGLTLGMTGCGKIGGPRFWWDDRTQTRLPEDYELPADPGAPVATDQERRDVATGEDITDEKLDSYHTDLDRQEEKRKSESALFDF